MCANLYTPYKLDTTGVIPTPQIDLRVTPETEKVTEPEPRDAPEMKPDPEPREVEPAKPTSVSILKEEVDWFTAFINRLISLFS